MGVLALTSEDREFVQTYMDAVITDWGKTCKIWYPPIMEPCPNCVPDLAGQKSSNVYLHGGPLPFQNGQFCPVCNGDYLRAKEDTDTVQMYVYFEVSSFKKFGNSNIVVPEGGIVTKCFISDVPKIQNCIKMQVQIGISPYAQLFYVLNSDGGDMHNLIQGRYFYHIWRRL